MRRRRPHAERGTVLVLVAAAIFPIVAMMTYAIDVSHWFDYSRNLQNRADAAALAGGTQYGDICFRSSFGDQWTGLQSTIGKWAQLYSGPGLGEPFDGGTNPAANVPYSDADVAAATGIAGPVYNNQPNLHLGSLNDYYVRLNADNYADKGGTNFAMDNFPGGNGFCNADPRKDLTDKDPGDPGAMLDVKVTQRQLPNFIPLFNLHPNIEAHARVEIQQIQSETTRPIAVGDASFIPCVTANFLDADGSVIASEKLTRGSNDPTDPNYNTWTTAPADAKNVAIPSTNTHPVTVQLFLNNCSTTSPTGIHYDYFDDKGHDQQFGLVYINNWGNPASPPSAPQIASGGVTLTGSNGTQCDPYFQSSSSACSVNVDAHVAFPAPGPTVTYFVRAVDADTGDTLDLDVKSGTDYTSSSHFSFASDSGPHDIHIWTAQLGGSGGGHACNTSDPWKSNNANCQHDLGVQQRAFSGINGTNACDNPNFETGPMQWITVGDVPAGSGANTYAQGANPKLYVTASIVGLSKSGPNDAPICLRVGEKTSHATGFIDCGQGNGTPADQNALTNGCPKPVQIDTRVGPDGALICNPAITPADCVNNNPGESPPVLKGLDDLIGNPAPGNCETNYWPAATGQDTNHVFSLDDKRAVVMIITAPTDLAVQHGTSDIPVREFAVFYVTGWSTGNGGVKGCTSGAGKNDPPPLGAGNGEMWGHWTNVTVPSGLGTGNGKQCVFTLFGNCIAVLTR